MWGGRVSWIPPDRPLHRPQRFFETAPQLQIRRDRMGRRARSGRAHRRDATSRCRTGMDRCGWASSFRLGVAPAGISFNSGTVTTPSVGKWAYLHPVEKKGDHRKNRRGSSGPAKRPSAWDSRVPAYAASGRPPFKHTANAASQDNRSGRRGRTSSKRRLGPARTD
jgi:hypothetical protein